MTHIPEAHKRAEAHPASHSACHSACPACPRQPHLPACLQGPGSPFSAHRQQQQEQPEGVRGCLGAHHLACWHPPPCRAARQSAQPPSEAFQATVQGQGTPGGCAVMRPLVPLHPTCSSSSSSSSSSWEACWGHSPGAQEVCWRTMAALGAILPSPDGDPLPPH